MIEENQRTALAELFGFKNIRRVNKGEFGGLVGELQGEKQIIPSFVRNLNDLRTLAIKLGLHNRAEHGIRVKWINNLRKIVDRRIPKNKAGSALTSDVDLLNCSSEEMAESILKTFSKWEDS